jgi:hypothetical protein
VSFALPGQEGMEGVVQPVRPAGVVAPLRQRAVVFVTGLGDDERLRRGRVDAVGELSEDVPG